MPKHTPAKRKANREAAKKSAAKKVAAAKRAKKVAPKPKNTKLAFKGDGVIARNKPKKKRT